MPKHLLQWFYGKYIQPLGVKKITIVTVFTFICAGVFITPTTFAQSKQEKQSAVDEKLELTKAFFASSLDVENLSAPFDDLFDQNQCKQVLVFSLRKKRDQLGSAIRKGVLDFDTTSNQVRVMISAWEVTSAEIAFVRDIELLADEDTTQALLAKVTTLYPQNQLLQVRARRWPNQYQGEFERIEACNPSWAGITQRWAEFKRNVANSADNLSKAFAGVQDEASGLVIDAIDAITDPKKNLLDENADYYGLIEFNTNIDFDKNNVWSKTYRQWTKSVKSLQGLDPVALQVQLRGGDVTLGDLAERSIGSTDEIDRAIDQVLATANNALEYNYVDGIINKVLTEAETTPQRFTEAETIMLQLTPQMDSIIARQCRAKE